MSEKIFEFIITKYENNVENTEVWNKLKTSLENETNLEKLSDMESFISSLGITVEKKLLEQKGYTEVNDESIKIFIDFTNPEKINRFTLAHELAHVMFDYSRLRKGERISSNYMENELVHDISEVRANQFAAELLMPNSIITEFVNKKFEEKRAEQNTSEVVLTTEEVIPQIVSLCNVSYSAVENRLKNLGMVK